MEKQRFLLPSEVEGVLLTAVQQGDKYALLTLTLANLWFLRKLAESYTDALDHGPFNVVLKKFEECARTIPLHNDALCFLEEVLKAVERALGDPTKTKTARKVAHALEVRCASHVVSLDAPITEDGEKTLYDVFHHQAFPSPPDALWSDELPRKVRSLLAELPKDERLPLTLHFLKDMDLTAIGLRLGRNREHVRGKVNKGLRRLRSLLRKERIDPHVVRD